MNASLQYSAAVRRKSHGDPLAQSGAGKRNERIPLAPQLGLVLDVDRGAQRRDLAAPERDAPAARTAT